MGNWLHSVFHLGACLPILSNLILCILVMFLIFFILVPQFRAILLSLLLMVFIAFVSRFLKLVISDIKEASLFPLFFYNGLLSWSLFSWYFPVVSFAVSMSLIIMSEAMITSFFLSNCYICNFCFISYCVGLIFQNTVKHWWEGISSFYS